MAAWQASRPVVAGVDAVRRALLSAEAAGCRLNILHLTSAAALDEVRAFRAPYPHVTVEVCHPYLACSEEDARSPDAKFRPPLRAADDVAALWRGEAEAHHGARPLGDVREGDCGRGRGPLSASIRHMKGSQG